MEGIDNELDSDYQLVRVNHDDFADDDGQANHDPPPETNEDANGNSHQNKVRMLLQFSYLLYNSVITIYSVKLQPLLGALDLDCTKKIPSDSTPFQIKRELQN